MAYNESRPLPASIEERPLIALDAGAYDPITDSILLGLSENRSPGIMSVIRPDLLRGLSAHIAATVTRRDDGTQDSETYKTQLFQAYWAHAEQGDVAAMSVLPQFVSSIGSLASTVELTLDNFAAISEWRNNRSYVQFIGSFNPQHVGHRDTIRATLEVAGNSASGIVQVVENHPIKKDSLPPYRGRFIQSEERLYTSTLLDATTVTALDLPLGLGLAKQGIAQIALLARLTGDNTLRWLVGSDKFITDVENVRNGKALDKAGARFSNVQLYVARRDTESKEAVEAGMAYVRNRFDAAVTLVPETDNPLVLAAAASKIRQLRSEGRQAEADIMEYADLPTRQRHKDR